jgi:glycosyltransferase involved in cell wall biosynthesis
VKDARDGELEVVVVCNGCTDRTAEVARGLGGPVKVIETPVGSKTNAMNLGDRAASGFPRFYVDADIRITLESLRRIAEELNRTGALAAGPRVRVDLSDASYFVRAFYEIDNRLLAGNDGIGHSGVYALSEIGRRRFEEFPPIVGDDAFVKRQFGQSERVGVNTAESIVTPPAKLWDLVRIKTRSHLGNYELARHYPELLERVGPSYRGGLIKLAGKPRLWLALSVYLWVKLLARMRARWQLWRGKSLVWERDESSRVHQRGTHETAG